MCIPDISAEVERTGVMLQRLVELLLAAQDMTETDHVIRLDPSIAVSGRNGNPLDVRIKRPPEKILELNTWIRKHAAENGEVYLDYFSAMVDDQGLLKKDLSEDGLHPNAAGYAVMAPLAEKAIQLALAATPPKR